MRYAVGIDPGLSGAVAAVSDTGRGLSVQVFDMPTLEMRVGGKARRRLDLHRLADILAGVGVSEPECVVYEDVSGRPPAAGVSQSGQFSQGWNACAPVAIAIAAGLVVRGVTPAVWKKAMGVSASKDGARAEAVRLFPMQAQLFARVKDDGRAEAALIAAYWLNKTKG